MTVVFRHADERLGELALRPVDPHADALLLHGWVTHPKAVFWQMSGCSVGEVEREYARIAASPAHDAFIGLHARRPAFLVERYDPAYDDVGRCYPVQQGDVGLHLLTAPADPPVHGFTRAVMVTAMEFLFADEAACRVVVEPDVRNQAIHRLNAAVGFRVLDLVSLPGKRALLCACSRAGYVAAVRSPETARA